MNIRYKIAPIHLVWLYKRRFIACINELWEIKSEYMKINKLKFGLFCLFIISYLPLFSQSKKIIKLMNLAKQEMTDTNYLGAINHLNEVLEKALCMRNSKFE